MKKIILSVILVCFFVFDGQAQSQEDNFSDFDRWQVRARAIVYAPAPYYYRTVNGVEIDFSTTFAPELDITFFFTRKFSAELALTTTKHDVEIVSQGNANAGSVRLIPPMINFQYHFYFGDFKPYIGAGLSYAMYSGDDSGQFTAVDYKDDIGYSVQGGLDYMLNDTWFLNLDFKKMFLKSEVTFNNDATTTVETNLDPIIAGIGVGMRF